MSSIKNDKCMLVTTAWLTLGALFGHVHPAIGVTDERFDVLQTKTGLYTNVTVTSKTEEWIFILHAGGMGNIKISDLTKDVQAKLGYAVTEKKESSNPIARLTMHELTDIKLPEIAQLKQCWREGGAAGVMSTFGNPIAVWAALGVVGIIYQFFCYCCMMICRRAHSPPGFLVWVPVFQIIPLLRAAGMRLIWFFAFLLPGVNLLALFVWYVRIVEARGKRRLLVLWLVLPFTSPFAFLYLAFSQTGPIKTEKHALSPWSQLKLEGQFP
jgi:hypothetical protein